MLTAVSLPQLLVIAGLILIMAELFVGIQAGFDLVAIGSALIIGGSFGLVTNNSTIALIASSLVAIIYIFFGRSIIQKKIIVLTHKTNIDKLIGQTGITVRSITPDTAGLVRLDDEDWRATSDEIIYEKDRVEVVGIEGVSIKVKKIKNNDNTI